MNFTLRLKLQSRLTPPAATGVPISEKRSEPSSDRPFAHGFNVLTVATQKITLALSLASSGVRVEIATQ
jgi:hypothetical protein